MNQNEVIKNISSNGRTGLMGRNFLLVVIGQIISLFGNAILRFALPLYILDQSGSAALFGMVSACSFLPMIIMSPVGGIIADRVNKQRIMVILDFTTAALILVFILLSGKTSIVPLVITVMMILYGIQGAYTPAVQSSIPLLILDEKILSANAVINLVNSFSGLLGPIIGGMLYGVYGLTPIVYVSCVCFLISAIMELFIRIPHIKRSYEGSVIGVVKSDLKESIGFIVNEKPILVKAIFIIFMFNLTFSSLLVIGLPVIITQTLGMGSNLYGISQGAMATGGLVGGIIAGIFGRKLEVRKAHIILFLCAVGLLPMGLTLYFNAPAFVSYLIITAMSFFSMALATIFSVQLLGFVQMETPVEIVGKVISCLMAASMCAQPIGQSIYGVMFEKMTNSQWILIIVSMLISGGIALFSKATFSTMTTKNNILLLHLKEEQL